MYKKYLLLVFLLQAWWVQAQTDFNATLITSFSSLENSKMVVENTLGEVLVNNFTNVNVYFTNGNNGFNFDNVSSVEEYTDFKLTEYLYPNPAVDKVYFTNTPHMSFVTDLIDPLGRNYYIQFNNGEAILNNLDKGLYQVKNPITNNFHKLIIK